MAADSVVSAGRLLVPLLMASAALCSCAAARTGMEGAPSGGEELLKLGYVDVTSSRFGADPGGERDSTEAIQAAIDYARDNEMACFFPPGTYRVSDTLECRQDRRDRHVLPCVLVGSTVDPSRRATVYLAPGSPGFDDPGRRKVVVHFLNKGTLAEDGRHTTHYDQMIVGLDITVGPDNDGAAALRMQSAEGTGIQDVNIDLTEGGHTGLWGIPGSGGSTHGVTVRGGEIGLDTRSHPDASSQGVQPTPTVTGLTLIGQRDRAVYARTRGALVGVGWRIETDSNGPVIRLFRHWQGEPFDSSLALVDSRIVYREGSPGNTVIEMGGRHPRSFFFENVYLRNAAKVHTVNLPEAPNGWVRAERLAVHAQPEPVEVLGERREVAEPVFVDGRNVGDVFFQAEPGEEPPADLQSRHGWGDHFPTFQSPGAANVKRYGAVGDGETDDTAAIQRAIDASEVVFLPKGHYVISDTLHLRPDTKLIGVHHSFTQIRARSSRERRFGGNTRPGEVGVPMIRTADDPDAETYLGFLGVRMTFPLAQHDPSTIGHYALEWRCGCRSLTRAIDITPHRSAGYYPAWVAKEHYGLDLRPDPNYPEDSMPAGKPVFCTKWPLVHIAGNGGGRWFNNWLHGGHMFREDCRIFLVEGTRQPLSFYHLHMQQQESAYHAEFRNAHNVSIYGVKCELKGGVAKFVDCDNVRMIGHGGLGTPDAGHGYTHLYLFRNTQNFLIACIGDDVNLGESRWIGGDYYRWVNASLGTSYPFTEVTPYGERVEMDPFLRPILYLRGDPGYAPCSAR